MAAWPACPTPSSMIAPPRTRIVVRVGAPQRVAGLRRPAQRPGCRGPAEMARLSDAFIDDLLARTDIVERSEEHTSELQSLMRISYAGFCLKKTTTTKRSNK